MAVAVRGFTVAGAVARRMPPVPLMAATPPATVMCRAQAVEYKASALRVASVNSAEAVPVSSEQEVGEETNKLACPICYYPLIAIEGPNGSLTAGSSLECIKCKKTYLTKEEYIDLTVSGDSGVYNEPMPAATELFRSPLVSAIYERGWRQNFIWGGFPGREKEFEMAKEYLRPTLGGTIIDASCGSGLFSRMFVKSGLYSLVVALDFSENMLRQCDAFAKEENISKENFILVRADISRLPFTSDSVDAVHAGAAIHCWPSPATAVAEVSRILRPGGVFVASTFILDFLPPTVPLFWLFRQYTKQVSSNNIFLSERELEEICRACGLVGFSCVRNGPFVMFSASKPGQP